MEATITFSDQKRGEQIVIAFELNEGDGPCIYCIWGLFLP